MVFLINIVPFLILALGVLVVYFVPGWKRKVGTALITIGLSVIYAQVQPSYMPKGTVRSNPVVEFKQLDTPMVDRQLKSKVSEIDALRLKEMDEIKRSMEVEVEKSKERLEALDQQIKSNKE